MTNSERETLVASGIVIERCRQIWTEQSKMLITTAAKVVRDIFSSQTDVRGMMEAELAYMMNESEFTHSDHKKMFTNTINAYRNALNLLKILTEEPEMYFKILCSSLCNYET